MLGLPIVAPEITAAHSVIGASTRELWLLFMGTLNASLGAGGLGWHAMKRIGSIPVWITPANKATVELRPALRTPVRAG
jgi:hypothetical protein